MGTSFDSIPDYISTSFFFTFTFLQSLSVAFSSVAGAGADFSTATAIATAMVKRYGMSEKVGVRVIGEEEQGMFPKGSDLSAATSELVDSEIKRLLQVGIGWLFLR